MNLLLTESRSLVWELDLPAILLPGKSASSEQVLAPFSQVRLPWSPEHYCRMAPGQRIVPHYAQIYAHFKACTIHFCITLRLEILQWAVSPNPFSIHELLPWRLFFNKKLKMTIMRYQYIYISSSHQQALHRYLEISLKPYFKYQLHLYTLR